MKLLTLYTKHVGRITAAREVDPPLALTPAEDLNAESWSFAYPSNSSKRPNCTFERGLPDSNFHYSVATAPMLQAELQRHGFLTRTCKKKNLLVDMYRKHVLKIASNALPTRSTTERTRSQSVTTGCPTSRAPESLPPEIVNSVYNKLTVMDLRKILELHPCVVRMLQKHKLVALCEEFKPAYGMCKSANLYRVQ